MPTIMRVFHSGLRQYFIVGADGVYADLDGDGKIAGSERYTGSAEPALLAAATHFTDLYDVPFPGARSLDPEITSGGRLNAVEAAKFSAGAAVPVKRADLLGHLDFFDRRDGDGWITLRESYHGWRDLGYRPLRAMVLAFGAAAIFGRLADGLAIDVERIFDRRPAATTRIYGPDGNVDAGRLAEFAAAFDQEGANGVLTHDGLKAMLAEKAAIGRIPKRQFQSLCLLTERINGSKTVTKAQFVGLFDNTLFWTVASMANRSGKRTLG